MSKSGGMSKLTLAKTGATGKRGSRRIQVTATFKVTFETDLDAGDFAMLSSGDAPLDDYVDESMPYRLLSDDGTCEMEWEPVKPSMRGRQVKVRKRA